MSIRILLDAGHYGLINKYHGLPKSKGVYYESQMSWALQEQLKKKLTEYGFSVGMTRTSQVSDKPVYERGKMAKGYDLFISLHSNTCNDKTVMRPVIIYPINADVSVREFAAKMGVCVQSTMGVMQKYQLYQRTLSNDDNTDYYGVIRGAVAANCDYAYIIEHGFHTNEYCATWLFNKKNIAILAEQEAATIAAHFGIAQPQTNIEYYPRYAGTTTSITSALKSIGVDYSQSHRAKIAKANGIVNYCFTASQNTAMLNLLKRGKLINPE